ncbi:5-aminolevulinate synthase, partial [Methylobacterium sp. P1-11]
MRLTSIADLQCPSSRSRSPVDGDYRSYFEAAVARLHGERRYRVFADIERISGRFPTAKWRQPDGKTAEIT